MRRGSSDTKRGRGGIVRGRGRGTRYVPRVPEHHEDAFYASSLPSAPPASSLPLPNIEWRTKSNTDLSILPISVLASPPTTTTNTVACVEVVDMAQKALKQAERRGGSLLQLPTNALPMWICHKQHRFSHGYVEVIGGAWCTTCEESISERAIRLHLEKLGLDYRCEMTFPSLSNSKAPLRFDYYIPAFRWLIEADGEQHFGSSKFKGTLLKRLQNDQIKDEWGTRSVMTLQRIPFWELDRIEALLDDVHSRLKRGEGPLYLCAYKEWREKAIRLLSQKKKAPPAPIPANAKDRTHAARDARREDANFYAILASEKMTTPSLF